MKYLCLIYYDEAVAGALPEEERKAIRAAAVEYGEELAASGTFIAWQSLETGYAATTIASRNGNLSVTGGQFAETKEQLDGFLLVEARDLNDAIRIASRSPSLRLGSIQIRPVKECA